jgi:hypothetical protein
MNTIIYTPTTSEVGASSDCVVASAITRLQSCIGARMAHHDGAANLQSLASGGGELFIVGHFHAGSHLGYAGLGMIDVPQLLQQLLLEGLPRQPQHAISLHLYACSQAACYRSHLEERFVIALCKEMVKQGCRNFKIFAYLSQAGRQSFYDAPATTPSCVEYSVESGGFRKFEDEHTQGDMLMHQWSRPSLNPAQMLAY